MVVGHTARERVERQRVGDVVEDRCDGGWSTWQTRVPDALSIELKTLESGELVESGGLAEFLVVVARLSSFRFMY